MWTPKKHLAMQNEESREVKQEKRRKLREDKRRYQTSEDIRQAKIIESRKDHKSTHFLSYDSDRSQFGHIISETSPAAAMLEARVQEWKLPT